MTTSNLCDKSKKAVALERTQDVRLYDKRILCSRRCAPFGKGNPLRVSRSIPSGYWRGMGIEPHRDQQNVSPFHHWLNFVSPMSL
jgi:hypothetical protein